MCANSNVMVQVAEAVGVASMRRSMLAQTADFMQLGLAPMQVVPLCLLLAVYLVRLSMGHQHAYYPQACD